MKDKDESAEASSAENQQYINQDLEFKFRTVKNEIDNMSTQFSTEKL